MVDVREIKGHILSEDGLRQIPRDHDEGEEYLITDGIKKATVYICGYCEEGFYEERERAEKCCTKEDK